MDDYLAKPVEVEDLHDVLRAVRREQQSGGDAPSHEASASASTTTRASQADVEDVEDSPPRTAPTGPKGGDGLPGGPMSPTRGAQNSPSAAEAHAKGSSSDTVAQGTRNDAMIDRETLLQIVDGDPDFLEVLIDTFLDECPSYMEMMHSAVEKGDAQALEEAAHALKGTVGNFRAEEAQETAAELEEIGQSGDLAEAPVVLSRLERRVRQLKTELVEVKEDVPSS